MVEGKDQRREARKQDFDPSAKLERKESRYIQQLKKSADIRKVDEERIFQMKLKKEADAEAHIFGDKEKFVTSAYKEKLAEMGRWKDEDARLKALETATTVEGSGSMASFYGNLLTKNLAMGTGDAVKDGTSAYTVGALSLPPFCSHAGKQQLACGSSLGRQLVSDPNCLPRWVLNGTSSSETSKLSRKRARTAPPRKVAVMGTMDQMVMPRRLGPLVRGSAKDRVRWNRGRSPQRQLGWQPPQRRQPPPSPPKTLLLPRPGPP